MSDPVPGLPASLREPAAPAPIALFVYKRPDHARGALAALAADPLAAASALTIFSDGPRNEGDQALVSAVRGVARQARGFASVRMVEQPRNLGLARSIIAGVSQLCEAQGRVIVLEDDLEVVPGFLRFMNEALNRYAQEPRVMHVSGYNYPGSYVAEEDALFLPISPTWGWATWQRAWCQFDASAAGYQRLQDEPALRRRFNLDDAMDFHSMLEQQLEGSIDSWGIRWLLTVFLAQGLALVPVRPLLRNLGADGSGTHGAGLSTLTVASPIAVPPDRVLRFPRRLEVNAQALEQVRRALRATRPGLIARARGRIGRLRRRLVKQWA